MGSEQAASVVEITAAMEELAAGHVVTIEPGVSVASFALYDVSRSVDTIVRGASGNIIELCPVGALLMVPNPLLAATRPAA